MATTQNTYTGNGSNKLFSITFPYLETSDIDVYLNNVLQTITTQYSFANATTIEFVTAPPNGATVKIDRTTDDSELPATFFPGSSIKAADLNADFDQTLYVVQEINNKALKLDDPLYVNKTYIDAADATKVNKSGDTMSGNLAMGGNRITNVGAPVDSGDAATRGYVDAYINTAYLGPLASDPALRPSGAALVAGDIYFNTTQDILKAWTGSDWVISAAAGNIVRWRKTASGGETVLSGNDDLAVTLDYAVGNEQVYLNGALQTRGIDYTAATGSSITFAVALTVGDVVELHAVQGYVSGTIPPESITNAEVAPAAGIQYSKLALGGSIVDADVNASANIASSKLSFTPSGTNAVQRTVQEKLRDIAIRGDYSSEAAFNAAKGTRPNIDGNDNFDARATPQGEGTQLSLREALRPTAGINRGRLNYYNATSVEVQVPDAIVMGGFRFMGHYKKGRAPVFSSGVSGFKVVSTTSDLGAEATKKNSNWYAVFACANDGDTSASYKLMPFVRVGSVDGSVCTLNYGGENSHTISAITYSWATNALANADCLVISEGLGNRFSGRTTSITANTDATITLGTIGTLGAYDYLLSAPPGFTHYCYLGAFYNDSAGEPYNIADNGCFAQSYMSANQDPNWVATGAVAGPPGNKIMWGGYISPLATGVYLRISTSTSTGSGGNIYTNFSHDSFNHVIAEDTYYKEVASTSATAMAQHFVNFSIGQFMYYWTSGGLEASRISGQLRAYGWIEP